jgi:hypothetical protein
VQYRIVTLLFGASKSSSLFLAMDKYATAAAKLERVLSDLIEEEERAYEELWRRKSTWEMRRLAARQDFLDALPAQVYALEDKFITYGIYTSHELAMQYVSRIPDAHVTRCSPQQLKGVFRNVAGGVIRVDEPPCM